MILNNRGHLVWYSPRPRVARDLKVVTYHDKPMLAFYQYWPQGEGPIGTAYYALYDQHYRLVKRITAGNGLRVDTHELQVTPSGTAYLAAHPYRRDPVTGAKVRDYVIQEVDIATGRVLFEWSALSHVPVSDSYAPRPTSGFWDYFHGNSIDISALPEILVSARNTSAIYAIDRRTGALSWTLGGKSDDFGMLEQHPAWQFCLQHDARRLPGGAISLFDDGGKGLPGSTCPVHASRSEILSIDRASHAVVSARMLSSTDSSDTGSPFFPWAMGSSRLQPNGDTLIAWGTTGRITEVGPGGAVNLGLRLGSYSYRAVRARWTGLPLGRPRVKAQRPDRGHVHIWMSWNGATRVRSWRILAGRSPAGLKPVTRVSFAGLETHKYVATKAAYVAVEALSADGRPLGRSVAVRT
jgi:hypothetical protein